MRVIFVAVVGLGFTCSSGCDRAAPESTPTPIASSKTSDQAGDLLRVDPVRLELGELWVGERQVHTVELHNRGPQALDLDVRSSCGCAVLNLPQARLEPGARQTLEVAVTGDGGGGPLRKHVWVRSGTKVLATMPLEAEVRPLWVFDPPVLDFGELVHGSTRRGEVRVRCVEGPMPETVEPRPGRLVQDVVVQAAGDELVVQASFSPEVRPGAHRQFLELACDHPRVPTISIPVSVRVVPAWSVQPERLDLGDVGQSDGAQGTLTVEWRGEGSAATPQASVAFAPVDGPGPALPRLRVELEAIAEGRWTVRVRIPPGSAIGAFLGRVELELQGPDRQMRAIAVSARVVADGG